MHDSCCFLFSRRTAIFLLLIAMASIQLNVCADEMPSALSLSEAVDAALSNNPGLSATAASVDAARADLGATRSSLYPSLSGSVSRTESDQTSYSSQGFTGSQQTGTTSYGVALDQNVYDFGRRRAGIKLAETSVTQAELTQNSQRLTIGWNTVTAYLHWIESDHAVKVRQEGLALARKHLESAQARLDVGRVSPLDVSREKVNVANAEAELIAAQNASFTALHDLLELMAVKTIAEFNPVEPVDFVPELIPAIDQLLPFAMSRRPDMVSARLTQDQQDLQLRLAKSDYWPSIGLSGQSSWSGDDTPLNRSLSATLALRMTFFNGFNTHYSVLSAQSGKRRAESLLEQTTLSIRTEIIKAHTAVFDAEKREIAAAEALQFARESLDLAEGRYEAGLSTELELADSRQTYLDASDALYRARNDRRKSFAALMFASGINFGEEARF